MSVIFEAMAWGIGIGVICVVFAGVRRIPWPYAGLVGLGFGLVFAVTRWAMLDASVEPAISVLIGAIGGSVATMGTERGERARVRRSAAILDQHPYSPA